MIVGDTVYFIKLRVVMRGKLVEKKDDDIWRIIYGENLAIELLSGFVYSSREQAESVLADTNKNISQCLTEVYNDLAWLYDPNHKGGRNVQYSIETDTRGEMNIRINSLQVGDYRYYVHEGQPCFGKVISVGEDEVIISIGTKDHLVTVPASYILCSAGETELCIQETKEKLVKLLNHAKVLGKIMGVKISLEK